VAHCHQATRALPAAAGQIPRDHQQPPAHRLRASQPILRHGQQNKYRGINGLMGGRWAANLKITSNRFAGNLKRGNHNVSDVGLLLGRAEFGAHLLRLSWRWLLLGCGKPRGFGIWFSAARTSLCCGRSIAHPAPGPGTPDRQGACGPIRLPTVASITGFLRRLWDLAHRWPDRPRLRPGPAEGQLHAAARQGLGR